MSRGYLVMAQGNYLDMAIALAESINKTQTTVNNISIVVDCETKEHPAVDKFIVLNNDISGSAEWKIHNRAFFYELSPYDETVILDADMLFLEDVSHWWNYMSKFEMLCTSKVKTYRNQPVVDNPYRKVFVGNQLPNVYSAFTYFKKTELTKAVFNLVINIITYWDEWTLRYTPEDRQLQPSLDVALALAIKVIGIEDEVLSPFDFPTFTHMKSGCQGWKNYSEDWQAHLGVYNSNAGIRLGNHLQSGILHYVDKGFLKELHK